MEQKQTASQIQSQIMSQKQIMMVRLIGMSSSELREAILAEAAENPAIEILRDPYAEGTASIKRTNSLPQPDLRFSYRVGSSDELRSDNFQNMLESSPDESETLQAHLIHQLNMLNLPEKTYNLAKRLIEDLDEKGFWILSPVSLLKDEDGENKEEKLSSVLKILRELEPSGVFAENIQESLELQCLSKYDSSKAEMRIARFLLHGHLDLVSSPEGAKVLKKIQEWKKAQAKLSFQSEKELSIIPSDSDLTVTNAENAVKFIQTLDPIPSRGFSSKPSIFVRPDVYVTKFSGSPEKEDVESGLVINDEKTYFRITGADDIIPEIQIAPDFAEHEEKSDSLSSEGGKFVKSQVKAARNFIEMVDFRKKAVIRSLSILVKIQKDFFSLGPGHLVPLTQRVFAEKTGVHESSVSRLADSKYIHTDWGTFPVKYFFTNAVSVKNPEKSGSSGEEKERFISSEKAASEISAENIRFEIQNILKAQKPGEKRLSDQKISDMLSEKGISVARRTVAKYRSQMNIESSYGR